MAIVEYIDRNTNLYFFILFLYKCHCIKQYFNSWLDNFHFGVYLNLSIIMKVYLIETYYLPKRNQHYRRKANSNFKLLLKGNWI
jgi:hypothetical protein